jgi:hypothetical protein
VQQAFGRTGNSIGGIAIGLLTDAGAIVPGAVRKIPARRVGIAACLAMLAGITPALTAIALHSIGTFSHRLRGRRKRFRAGFSSWIRLLIPGVPPAERTRLYPAFYGERTG